MEKDALDDEDFRLVQENLGLAPQSPMEDEEYVRRKDKSRDIFGDEEEEEAVDFSEKKDHLEDDLEYDSDDMGEFIVDEDGEKVKKRRKRKEGENVMLGPSAYQMDEAEELFGDLGEFMQGQVEEEVEEGNVKRKEYLKRYEPSVLSEYMLTEEDATIKEKDLPERMQRDYLNRILPDTEERYEAAEWICNEIFDSIEHDIVIDEQNNSVEKSRGDVTDAIGSILGFFHEDALEPGYVQRYCKEYFKPAGLKSKHVREIYLLDLKWNGLNTKKKLVDKMMKKTKQYYDTQDEYLEKDGIERMDKQLLMESVYSKAIFNADDANAKDLANFLTMHAPDLSIKHAQSKLHRPKKQNLYRKCKKGQAWKFSNAFTMTAKDLGDIISGEKMLADINVPTPEILPNVLAFEYTTKDFPNEIDISKAACHYASCEIAAEPRIRNSIRTMYRQRSTLSTTTTAKGREDIDEFHYCHGQQYLNGMPVLDFLKEDYYLRIHRAENEGYITSTIEPPAFSLLMDKLSPYFASEQENEWSNLRLQIAENALKHILLPSLESELRDELLQKARQLVVQQCGKVVEQRLTTRPYTPADGTDPTAIGVYLMRVDRDLKVYLVSVDANGEIIDKLQALFDRRDRFINQLTEAILTFIEVNDKTHIVVINTEAGFPCVEMAEIVDGIRGRLGRNAPDRFGNYDGRDYFHIAFIRDDIAKLYSKSKRAEKELPDDSEGTRAALSIARFMQNPLSEIAGLWDMKPMRNAARGEDLLYLTVHPMQHHVVKSALLMEYERVFCKIVNRVGVDINLAANHRHASYQLQFVNGLGPAKATALIECIRKSSVVDRRQALLSRNFLPKVVYRNAAPFLRIRERDMLADAGLNPLDDTRIHPESYYMAAKICGDANNKPTLDLYDANKYAFVVEDTMFNSTTAIKGLQQQPNMDGIIPRLADLDIQDSLSELDLAAYATRLQQEQKGLKNITLDKIRQELRYPYFDTRLPYRDPNDEDMLYMLAGETRDTFALGMIVTCIVINESRDFVNVRMEDFSIRATLRKENLPDYMDRNFLRRNGIAKGTALNARVLQFQTDFLGRYGIAIGCDDESIRDTSQCFNINLLPPYATTQKMRDDSDARIARLYNRLPIEDEPKSQEGEKQRKKRQIAHLSFKNIDCKRAIAFLKTESIGEAVFRPSSKGDDHITLTWKLRENMYRHYDIQEVEKSEDSRIGSKLVIKEHQFEDLDEILARFVAPMNDFVDDVLNHEKFRDNPLDEIEKELKVLKSKNPSVMPYLLHFTSKHPGSLAITFVSNTKPRTRYAEIRPDGFQFHGAMESRVLVNIGKAIKYFKTYVIQQTTRQVHRSRREHGSDRHRRR